MVEADLRNMMIVDLTKVKEVPMPSPEVLLRELNLLRAVKF
jgi:hypothetical protein